MKEKQNQYDGETLLRGRCSNVEKYMRNRNPTCGSRYSAAKY